MMNLEKKRWLILLPLAGLLLLAVVTLIKPSPSLKAEGNPAPLVSTQIVENKTITPFVTGYGRARPKQVWHAISEVSGRVIYRHPNLQQGKSLSANTVLLKVDPTDYELKLAQAKSDLSSAQAELTRTELNESKLTLSLQLEKKQLSSLTAELQRKKGLLKNGSVSQSTVDIDERNVLIQQQKVLDLENSIKQYPSDLAVAQAKVQLAESKLAEAQRKLDKTELVLPFDARIADIDVEQQQVINEGQSLLVAHKADVMEIPVQVPMEEMRYFRLFSGVSMPSRGDYPDIAEVGITAKVILHVGSSRVIWDGKLTSIGESVDSQGNTILMLVDVDLKQQKFAPGSQPPLINDMYVEVQVQGQPSEWPVIPADALHGKKAYTLSSESKLQINTLECAFENDGEVAVINGLNAGDKLITSDVIPPLEGLALRSTEQQK